MKSQTHVGQVLTSSLVGFALSALCCAPSLQALATRQPLGNTRSLAICATRPIVRTAKLFGLYSLHQRLVHRVHTVDEESLAEAVTRTIHQRPANLQSHSPIAAGDASTSLVATQPASLMATPLDVAVFGDSMAQVFGYQLARLGRRTGRAQVYFDAQASSGLTQPEIINWPERIQRTLAHRRAAAIVLVFGTNDALSLPWRGVTYGVSHPEWRLAYRQRVDAILRVALSAQVPVYWVGMPIMRSATFSQKMQVQNDIYREATSQMPGSVFIDSWAQFTDGQGQYAAYLPDSTGRSVLVRETDGIHYTHLGAQRLAITVLDTITAQPSGQ